jgi:signal transduction histidine kinase
MKAAGQKKRLLTIELKDYELHGKPAVLVRVGDTGCGFSPEEMPRLFEAFYTTKPNGMGMGLRISRSIVEAHGGEIWAKANVAGGATFSCAWPATDVSR